MFWRKRGTEQKGEKKKAVKEIVGPLLWHMVTKHGVTVDVLQNLRRVEQRERVVGGKQVIMIRIFDPASANEKGVAIDDHESLDSHPELILYEGYYRSVLGVATDIHIEKK